METSNSFLFENSDMSTDINAKNDEWQFSLDPSAPSWPIHQSYNQQLSSMPTETISNESDETFWDSQMWAQWDLSRSGNLPAQAPRHLQFDSNLATIVTGQLLSPISQASVDARLGPYFSSPSQEDYSSVGTTTYIAASSDLTTSISVPLPTPIGSEDFAPPSSTRKSAIPAQQERSSTSMKSTMKSKPPSRAAARNKPPSKARSQRVHNNVERQYRARLNDQYSTLLSALPKELTSADADKTLSKIDILDLAKKHIVTLQKEEQQLKEEKVALKGQIQVLGRLVRLTNELAQ